MKARWIVIILELAMTVAAVACASHRRPAEYPRCIPLQSPLMVESGAVSIACGWYDPSHLHCTISQPGDDDGEKNGTFMLADSDSTLGFDANDARAYLGWDGCYTIFLRDGRMLEEIEVVTSYKQIDGKRVRTP